MTANLSKLALAFAAAALLSAPALAGNEGNAASNHSAVFNISDESPIPGGSATLLRSVRGASFSAQAAGLEPDAAYTVWWIIFNNPENCENPGGPNGALCNAPDLGNPAVNGSVVWATGRVSDAYGFASFDAHLIRGGTPPGQVLLGPGLVGNGAEIHMVYRSHGPAANFDEATLQAALTTVGGGCNVNACDDTAFSIFAK